jgi:hypothetical protein
LTLQCFKSVVFKVGAKQSKEHFKSHLRDSGPKPHMANRVKSSSGPFNASWRRESGDGDIDQPEGNNFRARA